MSAEAISCRGLTKVYGDVRAVDGLDLSVPAGTVMGFLGPNGSGKTTVLRMLAGLTSPTRGTVHILGGDPAVPAVRRALGYMPADPAFHLGLTGLENLDLLAALQGAEPVDRDLACSVLGLPDAALRRAVRGYSSGMTQKLGLVQALQHRPELVVLDEPANRLDPLAHRRFEDLVQRVTARGGTVFLSSHTLSEVQDVCDRVAMVRAGRLLAVRDVAELSELAPRRLRIVYARGPERLPGELEDIHVRDGVLLARLPAGRPDLLRAALDAGTVRDVTVEPLTLEDAFVELYRAAA